MRSLFMETVTWVAIELIDSIYFFKSKKDYLRMYNKVISSCVLLEKPT